MAIRFQTLNNYFIITDTVTSEEILRDVRRNMKYIPRPQSNADNDYIYFTDINGEELPDISKSRHILRTEIVNGDDNDSSFADMGALNDYLTLNTGFSSAAGGSAALATGWADYTDTQYTFSSPFNVLVDTQVPLPNNAGNIIRSQHPSYFDDFYDSGDQLIRGREGDAFLLTLSLKASPSITTTGILLGTSIDIGGSIGEVYQNEMPIDKGRNVEHYYVKTFGLYSLDTWESNGGQLHITAINSALRVYDIKYVFHQIHRST